MGLIAAEPTKKKRPFKTIIIPKGVINPDENSVIEIPVHLDTNSSLIVRGPTDSKSCLSVEPFYSSSTYNLRNSYNTGPEVSSRSVAVTSNNEGATQVPAPVATAPTSAPVAQPITSTIGVTPSAQTPQAGIATPQAYQLPYACLQQQSQISHSLLCPICAQMTSRYVRPYNDVLKQAAQSPQSPYLGLTTCYQPPCLSHLYKTGSFNSSIKSTKSEITFRPERSSKSRDENVLLKKLLDDKIDKILKPILLSLAKSLRDDEEEEEEITPKLSYNCMTSKLSRERCYPKRYYCSPSSAFDDFKERRSHQRMRKSYSPEPNYDTIEIKIKPSYRQMSSRKSRNCLANNKNDKRPERDYKKPTVITKGSCTKMKEKDSDEDIDDNKREKSPRRSSVLDGKLDLITKNYMRMCPTTVSCQKRGNNNLEMDNDSSDSNFDDFLKEAEACNKSSSIDLDTKIYFKSKK